MIPKNKKNKESFMPAADLQDEFLGKLKQSGEMVAVFLINGIKLHGMIEKYDEHVLLFKNAATQMVYKHAISTVVPAANLRPSPKADS
jgi:host factor-I protein